MHIIVTVLVVLLGMSRPATTHEPQQAESQPPRPAAPTTYEGYVATVWKSLHNKILEMARDFPEDKYSWRPHPDSRTVLDEFRHVTIGLEMSAAELRGERFD